MEKETQNEKCESVADLIKILGSTFFDEVPRDLYITFYGDKPPKIDLAKLEFTDYEKFEFFDIYGYYFFKLNKIESLDSEKVANDPQLNALKLKKYWFAYLTSDYGTIKTGDNFGEINQDFKFLKNDFVENVREEYYRYNDDPRFRRANFVCRDHCIELPNGMLRTGYTTRTLPEWAIVQMRDRYGYSDKVLVTNLPKYRENWSINEKYLQR